MFMDYIRKQTYQCAQHKLNHFFFFKDNQIFRLPCCSTREDLLSIDVSITNVGLILTKLG